MKLYFSPGACSLASHIVLHETGIPFETEKTLTSNKEMLTSIHPKAYVPMLKMDNGEILTEGVAIMQYVADKKPEMNLMPKAGTTDRYRTQEWLNFVSTEIHKGFSLLFNANNLVTDETARNSFKEVAKKNLIKRFTWIDSELAKKDYLMGANYTVADAYLFTCMSWGKHLAVDTSEFTNLAKWNARVFARPAVQAALKTEGLLK
jgi:glutathione S-transferase